MAAQSGSSFYYSFVFLPPERRRAITALYAFCREVDDIVDNAVEGLTSLLEPIMIVLLAVIVGTIVIALFMPLISIIQGMTGNAGG